MAQQANECAGTHTVGSATVKVWETEPFGAWYWRTLTERSSDSVGPCGPFGTSHRALADAETQFGESA